MELLVLGGTKFVGRHLVEAALSRGHRVTLFNRGQTAPELFSEVKKIRGDRDGGLTLLEGRYWDAVVDTSGYVPRVVRASAEFLADAVKMYVFVSSGSVYQFPVAPGTGEEGPVDEPLWDEEEVTLETYGGMKVACERVMREALSGRALVVRPGLVVGPHDPPTDRFAYWPRRFYESGLYQGGEVLAPGDPDQRVQFVDARDLGIWIVEMVERGVGGTFNAVGPDYPLTMDAFLQKCRAESGGESELVWVDEEFLRTRGVDWAEWELPLWFPNEYAGFMQIDSSRAISAGLKFRALGETVRDVLAWDLSRPETEKQGGMDRERERELLRDEER